MCISLFLEEGLADVAVFITFWPFILHCCYRLSYPGRGALCLLKIQPAQLGCLGGSVGRASAWYAEHYGFESRLRQLIFFETGGVVFRRSCFALPCLVSLTEFTCIVRSPQSSLPFTFEGFCAGSWSACTVHVHVYVQCTCTWVQCACAAVVFVHGWHTCSSSMCSYLCNVHCTCMS